MEVQELMLMNFMEQTRDCRELKRAITVRMRLQNYSREQVAELLNVGPDYVTKWSSKFKQEGVAGLKIGYQGSSGYLGEDERREVIEWLTQQKQWSLDSLSQHLKTEYKVVYQSKQSYYEILKQAKLSWKKVEPDNPKKDPEQVAAKQAELRTYFGKNRPKILSGERIILFVDECHLLWKNIWGYGWGPIGQPLTTPISNGKQKQTYYGALNLMTGQTLLQPFAKGDSEATLTFLDCLRANFPAHQLTLIWDGATYHRSDRLRAYLDTLNHHLAAEQWPITCIQLAPHAPEQNPLETVWGYAKAHLRQSFHSLPSFAKVKHLFVDTIKNNFFLFQDLLHYQKLVHLI
jgi:putative transposase